jgi:hypothetical protein
VGFCKLGIDDHSSMSVYSRRSIRRSQLDLLTPRE